VAATAASIAGRSDVLEAFRPAPTGDLVRYRESTGAMLLRWLVTAGPITAVLAVAAFLRLWRLDALGYNSDEAVYAGTAASMAGRDELSGMFPVFRAHPLLFQTLLSLTFRAGLDHVDGRLLAAVAGILAVGVTFLLGRRLYGTPAGIVAALLLAAMPYHVLVSRQVLLDGPMTLFATTTLYCVARYCEATEGRWLVAAGGAIGATILCKETSVILLGSLYAFFALAPVIRIRMRHVVPATAVAGLMVAAFPVVLALSTARSTGENYFLWQLSRRANHPPFFYADVLPGAIGVVTLGCAVGGLVLLRRRSSWRERLLAAWILVPLAFFTIWPLKGYQYLLPAAPAVAVLAGRTIAALRDLPPLRRADRRPLRDAAVPVAALAAGVLLLVPSLSALSPVTTGTFLAGTGGVPGGREAGRWLREQAPVGSQLLTIGPSMANILQFYGERRAYGLSVSANPRDRNPAYVPVPNPDRWVRDGKVQYLVWDSFTADRTPFFAAKLEALVQRYHGVAVYTATVPMRRPGGGVSRNAVVVVYQVWPS
jgi:4-amino-4-deoxy-L-arabinose transferase-like glycosyltransferase